MKLTVAPGTYIVAVSGGVDSVVLLDLLTKLPDVQLVVAHFDHGIRSDSDKDRLFVRQLAQKYKLPFESAEGKLGPEASEDKARQARYDFLDKLAQQHQATAIITAHHQDDVLETMLLNLLRGTGRKGLTSLANTKNIRRPLLQCSKQQIKQYANDHQLAWREDSTNTDLAYKRNWVRQALIPKLSTEQRDQLLAGHGDLLLLNTEIDALLDEWLGSEVTHLSKQGVIMLPVEVAQELVAHWLRRNDVRAFDKKAIARLVVGARTLASGKEIEVYGGWRVRLSPSTLQLVRGR